MTSDSRLTLTTGLAALRRGITTAAAAPRQNNPAA